MMYMDFMIDRLVIFLVENAHLDPLFKFSSALDFLLILIQQQPAPFPGKIFSRWYLEPTRHTVGPR